MSHEHPAQMKYVHDNASYSKTQLVLDKIRVLGIQRIFHPPYSPDLNPIEMVFNRMKQNIEYKDRSSIKELEATIARNYSAFTPNDIENLYLHQKE